MSPFQDSTVKFEKLREQAEELIRRQPEFARKTPEDMLTLIHELKIHQVELEIQNEELKRAQVEISELHREFENLYEFAPCGYLTLNPKGLITRANLTAVTLLETTRRFLLHSGFSNYILPGWEDAYQAARRKAVETRKKQEIPLPLKRKDGSTAWARADIEADFDETGTVTLWRMVLTDITAQRKAEEDRERMEAHLQQARKMESVGNLAGGVAHEFNNMLYIIIGNSELALEQIPEWSAARDNLKEIRAAGLRASEVVRQLLIFSRKDDASKMLLPMGEVIKESMKLIRSGIPENIGIEERISRDVDPIFGNAVQINQLLIILCSNAKDAMPEEKGVIIVELANETITGTDAGRPPSLRPGRYVRLTLGDNGCGMDKKTVDRAFDPYFTTKAIGKGAGIGLAVVHGIVDGHNGAVSVESAPGKGTVFTILFPAHQGEAEQKAPEGTQ